MEAQRRPAPPRFPASEILQPYVPRLAIEWLRQTPELRYKQVEGSLAFVDISGFTSLTERLSRRGKVGAEEMNDLLGVCFTELLSVAYDYSASVIKWGGDAVLLLFTGKEHEACACRGAYEMQRTIRSAGKLDTFSGRVTLRMSVGIHSGLFDFFFVGDLHRELVLTGPGATATVEMEAVAEAGEIVVSSVTASALDHRCLGAPRGLGFLLMQAPDVASERAAPVRDVGAVDLTVCVPIEVREHLLAGGGEAEHRPLTAAFIQFMRADDILTGEGPDTLADALEQLLATVQRVAREHRVAFFETDIAPSGGKIMLMAGAPRSAGNDEERMLRAMRAIVDAEAALPVRIGINWGRIFVGDFGPPYRRTYSVKGDAVNLAARLMARAEPGQVLATDDVLRRSRMSFDVEPLEPFRAKGKSELVQAFAVGSVGGVRAHDTEMPLIGREDELGSLLAALDLARGGCGQVVEVVAEPGMGKSRLIEELRSQAEGVRIIWAQCDEYEISSPYFALHTVLSQLLDLTDGAEDPARRLQHVVEVMAPELLPWLPLLGVPLGLELDDTAETAILEEQFRRARVDEMTGELLRALLPESTLLVFEDTHWMDEASSEFLSQLLANVAGRPWLVIVARRDQPTGFVPQGDERTRIELEPLTGELAEELVHAATGEVPLLPHEIAALTARAGGNPFFLTQLISAARAAGGVEALPDSLEAVMMAEIDRLAPADRRVLRCAAVVGATFQPELVAASLDEPLNDDVWQRLAHYLGAEDGGAYRFRHALVRDAAYEGLPYRRRRELHEWVGLAVETRTTDPESEAELLSLHFFSAHDYPRAWRYSRIAGERAQAIYANVEAATFFKRALEAARHLGGNGAPADVAAVHEHLGDVRLRLGEFTGASVAYRASRRLPGSDSLQEARLLLKEAMIPFRLARYPVAMRWLNRGLRVIDGLDSPDAAAERVRISVWCANTRQRQHRPKDAIAWCKRAIADAAQTTGDTRHALGHAYVILDWAYRSLGRPEDASYSPLALGIYEELGDLEWTGIVLNNMGVWAYMEGRWDDSLELYRRVLETDEMIGDRWGASLSTFNIAEILTDQGRLEEAGALATAALRVWTATRQQMEAAYGKNLLGRIAARSGRFDESRSLLEEARALYLESNEPAEALRIDAAVAECLVLQGDSQAALSLVDRTLAGSSEADDLAVLTLTLRRLRGCALLQLGRFDEARLELEEALRLALILDADYGKRTPDYEAVLILDALVRLGGLIGERSHAERAPQRDQIVARLGIVALPEVPLPDSSGAASRVAT